MNVLYLLLSLSFISFSFADLKIGANTAVFRIGRDIYSYGEDDSGNLFKYGIDENKNIYSTRYKVKDLEALCLFCFSFVMENDSVLTLTGYDSLGSVNGSSTENNMGVYYFNPVEQTAPKGKDYKKLPGSPVQREYHQAVMTPDKKSVYIFGGIEHKFFLYIDISIVQFDISSSTFINHQLFRFVGGTATMLP
jgi:hypothetical protein